jgi:hypothetical protein
MITGLLLLSTRFRFSLVLPGVRFLLLLVGFFLGTVVPRFDKPLFKS